MIGLRFWPSVIVVLLASCSGGGDSRESEPIEPLSFAPTGTQVSEVLRAEMVEKTREAGFGSLPVSDDRFVQQPTGNVDLLDYGFLASGHLSLESRGDLSAAATFGSVPQNSLLVNIVVLAFETDDGARDFWEATWGDAPAGTRLLPAIPNADASWGLTLPRNEGWGGSMVMVLKNDVLFALTLGGLGDVHDPVYRGLPEETMELAVLTLENIASRER